MIIEGRSLILAGFVENSNDSVELASKDELSYVS